MANLDIIVNETLGITGGTGSVAKEVLYPASPKRNLAVVGDDTELDYKYSRENFYNLIERGQDAIDGILEIAKEGEHPRAYEVVGQLIKNVSEVTEKLADLQEKMKKLKEVPETGPKNVTNALFIGSTKELQKMLKSDANI